MFLNQHNLGLTNSSFNSGYVGDVESEDIFSFPGNSYKNRKSRYTSSTLGSSIPRASIKTVFSNSPNDNDSPKEDDEEGKFPFNNSYFLFIIVLLFASVHVQTVVISN